MKDKKIKKRIEDPLLIGVEEEDDEYSALSRLIELGRQKSYITIDDILHFFPEAEQDVEQLEEAFAALLSAGIPFIEDASTLEPSEDELIAAESKDTEAEAEPDLALDDYLANIDTDDTIGLYLKEVSRVPLLTAEEEVELAQRIERGRMAREELVKGNVSPRRRMELRRLIEDGWAAREHLITANSRLVISVAKKYMGRGVPFLDLIQEGNIGVIRATKKFDYRRGHKFSTYATWWIRQAVTRAIAVAKLAHHLAEEQAAVLKELRTLASHVGHVKDIISVQQSVSRTAGVVEPIALRDLVEDALHMVSASLARYRVRIVREYTEVPQVKTDKHRVLQILVNLMTNALDAMKEAAEQREGCLTVRVRRHRPDPRTIRVEVEDNGVGIPPENLTRIFTHGFTTKKKGHGFGLHSSSLSAKELQVDWVSRIKTNSQSPTSTLIIRGISAERARSGGWSCASTGCRNGYSSITRPNTSPKISNSRLSQLRDGDVGVIV